MKCPKCNNEMKMWYSEDGYANAWKCPKCNYTCENQESNNDKMRFMNLLDSLEVKYVTGADQIVLYYQSKPQLSIKLRKSDICICSNYSVNTESTIPSSLQPANGLPLNILYNLVIRFNEDGKFEGFTPFCAE